MVAPPRQPTLPEVSGEGWREDRIRSTQEAAGVLEAVIAAMAAAGYSKKELFEFRLALEEAIVNAIKHGHHFDPGKLVRVRYRVEPERALAEIEDEGPGFDPDEVPDPTAPENLERPCGRGLFLIRAYMSWILFNERGNKVMFCKARSGG
jgi:serine/threonine-protein kinase RsbW